MPNRTRYLAAMLPLLALAACGQPTPDQTATAESTGATEVVTEWTVENPTEPAVPVNLPTTRMTNESVSTAPDN